MRFTVAFRVTREDIAKPGPARPQTTDWHQGVL